MTTPSSRQLVRLLLAILIMNSCIAFVPQAMKEKWAKEGMNLDKALKTIEGCSERRDTEGDELYSAVRYIDRNAHLFYSTPEEKRALFEKSLGSWELRMAYEDSKSQVFFPYPDFREFAMAFVNIEKEYFGKGIAQNPYFCFVAMGGPAAFNERTRQLYMNYEDFYISGRLVPDWDLSYFMRGYARNWYESTRKRPPLAFTLIGVTDKVLIVRGSKTGGMAIFRKIGEDMRQASYGSARG
jgi:hypothetical protein